jgi:hypothetical protein
LSCPSDIFAEDNSLAWIQQCNYTCEKFYAPKNVQYLTEQLLMQPGNLALGSIFESPVRVIEVVEDNIEFFAVDFFQVCTACHVISSQHAP